VPKCACGAESPRVRITFRGKEQIEECPYCAPQSFDKFKSVRDGQISMAYEYDHTHYHFEDGKPVLTDEGRQDLRDAATKESEDDKRALEAAVEKKRYARRTTPLTSAEIERAVNRFNNESRESV